MITVIVTRSDLEAHRACHAYLDSPEWNGESLVYSDWEATTARLSGTREGLAYLGWLVRNGLVPMTQSEYLALRRKAKRAFRQIAQESNHG